MTHRRSLVWLTVLVLAQAATGQFKAKAGFEEKTDLRAAPPLPQPQGGYWAPPPGESGASRHAPRPGPGAALPETEEFDRIELDGKAD